MATISSLANMPTSGTREGVVSPQQSHSAVTFATRLMKYTFSGAKVLSTVLVHSARPCWKAALSRLVIFSAPVGHTFTQCVQDVQL